jgi:hypothetical protein
LGADELNPRTALLQTVQLVVNLSVMGDDPVKFVGHRPVIITGGSETCCRCWFATAGSDIDPLTGDDDIAVRVI